MRFFLWILRRVLSLRYRVRLRGMENIDSRRDGAGRLFLPNHPALIDPVILIAWLWPRFRLRPLADARQVDRFFVRWVADRLGVVRIPDASRDGQAAAPAIGKAMDEIAARLDAGENILLYPAGRMLDSRYEVLGAASGAANLLLRCPSAMPVAVRTRGLWGSAFSRADGVEPRVGRIVLGGLRRCLANGIFFLPRRDVGIELCEAVELPRREGRRAINRWLEDWHNEDAPPRLYVPRSRWEGGGARALPDPSPARAVPDGTAGPDGAPPAVREVVRRHLRALSGIEAVDGPGLRLSADLGLDSLAVGALAVSLAQDLDVPVVSPDRLATVADVYAAAQGRLGGDSDENGDGAGGSDGEAPPPLPPTWFRQRRPNDPLTVTGRTLPEALMALAEDEPGRGLWTDGRRVQNARDLLTAIHALAQVFARLPAGEGGRLGLLLPAGGPALTAYYAALWAGRTPVLFNWTLGAGGLAAGAEALDVRAIVTAAPLIAGLERVGMDFAAVRWRLTMLDQLAASLGGGAKLRAAWRARRLCGPLTATPATAAAAVLFTSGSEAEPKRVPLTHANLLANLRDVVGVAKLRRSDTLLAMLPPFHSFGLLAGLAAPGAAGLRAAYHPNPLEGPAIARLIRRTRATLLVGTPTFVDGIVKAASPGALDTIRLAITGAEACRESLRRSLAEKAPDAAVIEGYGVTECSPILSVDDPEAPTPGSIGRPLPSVDWVLVDPEDRTRRVDGDGRPGQLLVRGPSIFGGYLVDTRSTPAESPDTRESTESADSIEAVESPEAPPAGLVDYDGGRWFDTGDLIRVADGRWHFAGRRKRFVKMGGEMISLPSVEEVLERRYPPAPATEGGAPLPRVAVVAVGQTEGAGENARLWAIAAADTGLTREAANALLREAGLSALHGVKGVLTVDSLPLLGTGKIDYRTLQALAEKSQNVVFRRLSNAPMPP